LGGRGTAVQISLAVALKLPNSSKFLGLNSSRVSPYCSFQIYFPRHVGLSQLGLVPLWRLQSCGESWIHGFA